MIDPKRLPNWDFPRRLRTSRTSSIASRRASEPTADVAYAHRSTTICNLINIVREVGLVGERLKWDPKAERFTNCDEANENRWMTRPRRKGYELPTV